MNVPATTDRGPQKVTTAEQLKARATHHDVTLPSGAVVSVKLPNLPQMIKAGKIPNELIDAALKQQSADTITRELLEETWEFTEFIVPLTLVSPPISKDDVAEIDVLDLEMLANFASRRTDLDAVGHQLGGLETQRAFREFRDLVPLREALGDG